MCIDWLKNGGGHVHVTHASCCRQQVASNNEQLRKLQEAEAACEAEAVAAARAVEYRNELRHRLDIQVTA